MNAESKLCATGDEKCATALHREFRHLRSEWLWLFLYGVLLTVCGVAAVIFPALTVLTSFVAVAVLGIVLIVAGVSTVIASFWAGRWSGMLLQLLVGVLYVAVGVMMMDSPLASVLTLTLFVAAFFIVVGAFRVVAALAIRFPYWGWALLNGIVTLLLGIVIYRLYQHFPPSAIWILGLLVGMELLFHGWNWIVLAMGVKNLPKELAE